MDPDAPITAAGKAERVCWEQVYPILRALSHRQLPRRHECTLQPTELAHEAFLKLSAQQRQEWNDQGHFLAVAARVIRRVTIDYLRERAALKRGPDARIPLESVHESEFASDPGDPDWLRIDTLLQQLERVDRSAAELVEMRCFAGLSVPEIARAREVSESTVAREWRWVRAWLEERLDSASLGDIAR